MQRHPDYKYRPRRKKQLAKSRAPASGEVVNRYMGSGYQDPAASQCVPCQNGACCPPPTHVDELRDYQCKRVSYGEPGAVQFSCGAVCAAEASSCDNPALCFPYPVTSDSSAFCHTYPVTSHNSIAMSLNVSSDMLHSTAVTTLNEFCRDPHPAANQPLSPVSHLLKRFSGQPMSVSDITLREATVPSGSSAFNLQSTSQHIASLQSLVRSPSKGRMTSSDVCYVCTFEKNSDGSNASGDPLQPLPLHVAVSDRRPFTDQLEEFSQAEQLHEVDRNEFDQYLNSNHAPLTVLTRGHTGHTDSEAYAPRDEPSCDSLRVKVEIQPVEEDSTQAKQSMTGMMEGVTGAVDGMMGMVEQRQPQSTDRRVEIEDMRQIAEYEEPGLIAVLSSAAALCNELPPPSPCT